MPSAQIIEFYSTIREQPGLWAELDSLPDADTLARKVSIIARQRGFTLSDQDIRNALPQMLEIINQAANGESLTDDELELVSAGASLCNNQVMIENDVKDLPTGI